ncbi:MAG: four helix bundle protein [Bacteroidales bacterium]|nr:four helix bundle protein [Bacteroidales bacterium]
MFDFENLEVYKKAKFFNKSVSEILDDNKIDKVSYNQLRRASFSIMLNIAEGSGRYTNPDKRRFYVIARGSAFECAAIFDYLRDLNFIEEKKFQLFYISLEEISKMLFALIRKLEK